MAIIKFSSADRSFAFKNKKNLKLSISNLFQVEGKKLKTLDYIFCSDDYLLKINKQFLNHDDLTDIITFDLSETQETIGEIYVSLDRVKDNAKILGVRYQDEIIRVIFHGALHLCGYGDKTKSEITIMREKEDGYLRLHHKRHESHS